MCIHSAVPAASEVACRLAGPPPESSHPKAGVTTSAAATAPPPSSPMAASPTSSQDTGSLINGRPNFPGDLRILLLEPDLDQQSVTAGLLAGLGYRHVRRCSSLEQAAAGLQQPLHRSSSDASSASLASEPPVAPRAAVDVVLADLQTLLAAAGGSGSVDSSGGSGKATMCDGAQLSSFRAALAATDTPLVLMMGQSCGADEIMAGLLQLNAAECLERPLAARKLQTLWQHTVRREMRVSRTTPGRTASDSWMMMPPPPPLTAVKTAPATAPDGPLAAGGGSGPSYQPARLLSDHDGKQHRAHGVIAPLSPWGVYHSLDGAFEEDDFDFDTLMMGYEEDIHAAHREVHTGADYHQHEDCHTDNGHLPTIKLRLLGSGAARAAATGVHGLYGGGKGRCLLGCQFRPALRKPFCLSPTMLITKPTLPALPSLPHPAAAAAAAAKATAAAADGGSPLLSPRPRLSIAGSVGSEMSCGTALPPYHTHFHHAAAAGAAHPTASKPPAPLPRPPHAMAARGGGSNGGAADGMPHYYMWPWQMDSMMMNTPGGCGSGVVWGLPMTHVVTAPGLTFADTAAVKAAPAFGH